MFRTLGFLLKLFLLMAALYGIFQLPIEGEPLWRCVQQYFVGIRRQTITFASEKTTSIKRSGRKWMKKFQEKGSQREAPYKAVTTAGHSPSGMNKDGNLRENITAFEEKELERILEEGTRP